MARAPPAIAALFLVRFDHRVGYSIVWQRHIDGLNLDGAVEFRSLPSGLHDVKTDIVYFHHADCAGVSVYQNNGASETHRNASFLAVGALVPLHGCRLGKAWRDAANLQHIAAQLQRDSEVLEVLDSYWKDNRFHCNILKATATSTTEYRSKPGSASVHFAQGCLEFATGHHDTSECLEASDFSSMHPVHSVRDLMTEFGPLIFPLLRAVVCKQRILLAKHPPLRKVCEYVYLLSIMSDPTSRAAEALAPQTSSEYRALFSIGIHDIPELEQLATVSNLQSSSGLGSEVSQGKRLKAGWIACSSDMLITQKKNLYDIRVEMPRSYGLRNCQIWPKIATSNGDVMLASQRDLREYKRLMLQLDMMLETSSLSGQDAVPLLANDRLGRNDAQIPLIPAESTIVARIPWAAVVYNSFLGWASASEHPAKQADEAGYDAEAVLNTSKDIADLDLEADSADVVAMAVIAYFRRVSSSILNHCLLLLNRDTEEFDHSSTTNRAMIITKNDMISMSMDIWSDFDHGLVQQLMVARFGKLCTVEKPRAKCCGIKLF